jgi:hypothetical protein
LKRLNQKKSQISKLHKNDLFVESRYWRQMLRHRFSQEFQMTAQKEFFELKKKNIFSWVKKANQSRILFIWVFKYKFDTNDYLKKFKTRLCVKSDFQSTNQNIYAITLIVKILKTVTVWVQIYTYKSADWSMILQSSLLFFYITSISWRFEFHQVILWSHLFYHRDHIVWLISLSSIDFSSSIDSINFREDHVIFVIFELNYSRIVNDSLNLIRRTR